MKNERKGVASKWLLSMSRVRSPLARSCPAIIIFVSVPIYECARPRSQQVSCESQLDSTREKRREERGGGRTRGKGRVAPR